MTQTQIMVQYWTEPYMTHAFLRKEMMQAEV
jgi:hypothetical protein